MTDYIVGDFVRMLCGRSIYVSTKAGYEPHHSGSGVYRRRVRASGNTCIICGHVDPPNLWPGLCWVCDPTAGPYCCECYRKHFEEHHPEIDV